MSKNDKNVYRRIMRKLESGRPMVAYMAHPYSRNPSDNKTDARMAMAELHHRFSYVAFINPLDNFRAIDGEEYEAILFLCKQMISRCDLVIFAGDRAAIADSRGCAEEFAAARYAHGIPCFHFDKDGLFYPMFDFKF